MGVNLNIKRDLKKIRVRIGDQDIVVDPTELLTVDYCQIKRHLEKYAADFAWVGSIKEAIATNLAAEEERMEYIYATKDLNLRAKKAGDKEREIKSLVLTDPDYCDCQKKVRELAYLKKEIDMILNALDKFQHMLVQLSGIAKIEMSE